MRSRLLVLGAAVALAATPARPAQAAGDFFHRLDRAEVIGNASGGAGCAEDFAGGLGTWSPVKGSPAAAGGFVEFRDPGEAEGALGPFYDVGLVREDVQAPSNCHLSAAGGAASLVTEWVSDVPLGPGDYYGHLLVYALSTTQAESISLYVRRSDDAVAAELGTAPGLRLELQRASLDTSDPNDVVLAAPLETQTLAITPEALSGATGGRIHLRLDYSAGWVDARYSLDGGATFEPPFAGTSSDFFAAIGPGLLWAGAGAVTTPPAPPAPPSYVLFESGPVRPVALSPDGTKLFVTNTPDGHLEVFDVDPGSGLITAARSVPVGLEPVAVAARNDDEVWVVNHLSDSVSIVDVASDPPRVVRTVLVGDEPRDIVFAGSPGRAFVTTAHRGQHRTDPSITGVPGAGGPQLTTEGVGRADVWVFDAADPGAALGGVPERILSFFADTPRALATDGSTVYVGAFHSGNRSTALNQQVVAAVGRDGFASSCGGGGEATGLPGPAVNFEGAPAPSSAVILQQQSGTTWVDAQGCTWTNLVRFDLPDLDVFTVDADTLVAGPSYASVGTILFNMAINPVTGQVYVTNTESPNLTLFEGPGDFGGSTVQGHLSEARISLLDPAVPGSVTPRHLNSHIDYDDLHTDPGANHAAIDAQIPHSLATPLQVVVSDEPGDQTVYVAAFGSSQVGVLSAQDLENGTLSPTGDSAGYIPTGGGPAGLALSDANDRLYVLTRFDQKVSVFEVGGGAHSLLQSVRLPTPEPASVVLGRPFLYDAVATSGNGEASCASCHIFGDLDGLAWNLGNPDEPVTTNTVPQLNLDAPPPFHPMKGPMTTQTLRGLATHGGLHWRADRVNGFFGLDPCNGSSGSNAPCDEAHSFDNFIVAFEGLVGKDGTLSASDMQAFTDFALQLALPPNPVANLDGSLTAQQAAGEAVYHDEPSDGDPAGGAGQVPCVGCHFLDPALGFFGAGGEQTFEGEPQRFKVAHLRNMAQKVGMFGLAGVTGHLGDQVRGFGFLHDGSVDTLKTFVGAAVFDLTSSEEDQLEQFMLAFPSDVDPVVGQQVGLGPGSPQSCVGPDCLSCNPGEPCLQAWDRVVLLQDASAAPFESFALGGSVTRSDLVVRTVEAGVPRSYLAQGGGASYQPDDGGPAIGAAALRAKGTTQDLQYLSVPPGSGPRMGLDRDEDAVPNGLDNCPAWANGATLGTCTAGDAALVGARCTASGDCGLGGSCSLAQQDTDADGTGDACEPLFLPEPGGALAWLLGAGLVAALRRRRQPARS